MQAASLDVVLARPMDGVARVILEHHRMERFRWMAIVELTLGVACLICLLPLIILIALFSEADLEIPSIGGRLYHRWHELRVTLLDPWARPLAYAAHVPTDAEAGRAAVAAVLAAADRNGLVVVETLAGGVSEVAEVWYGGRPLLAHPEEHDERHAASVLQAAGLEIHTSADEVVLVDPGVRYSLGQRVLGASLGLLAIPLLPLLLLSDSGRRGIRHFWLNLRGASPERRVVTIRPELIKTHREREGESWDEDVVDGRDILGITFSPSLGYDRDVTRHAATLRLVGRTHSRALDLPGAATSGRTLRELIVAATLRLRSSDAALGLSNQVQGTRCPFCAALYVMQPGSRCPSCGAHAGTTP